MAISSNNSSSSLRLNGLLGNATKDVGKALTRLASGKRINTAQDDAAGLAIVSALESSTRVSNRAANNASDGISVANIADSVLSSVSDISSRQQELAAQAANGVYSDEQRASLNEEYQQLESEKIRQLSTAEFNGQKIFDSGDTQLQVGNSGDSSSQISLPSVNTSSLLTGGNISSAENARAALDDLRAKSDTTSSLRSQIGAAVSRIDSAQSNLLSNAAESEAAASRIRDADVAEETAKLVSAKIRQNATAALYGQANQTTASVLALLK